MGDMGDLFNAMKERSQERRASNRDNAPEILRAAEISFSEHNLGAHLIVTGKFESFDFWPGTGRWTTRGAQRHTGFGVFNLIKRVKGE